MSKHKSLEVINGELLVFGEKLPRHPEFPWLFSATHLHKFCGPTLCKIAEREGKDVIWDQTSTTVASRKRKFNSLRNYEHIAVVFATPEKDELERRLASRPGKNIPAHVMQSMINGFDKPTEDEGFKEIWYV